MSIKNYCVRQRAVLNILRKEKTISVNDVSYYITINDRRIDIFIHGKYTD